ncbi:MAG: hypothetical protein R2713_16780 [Ilumatobacteraceae bacterium]
MADPSDPGTGRARDARRPGALPVVLVTLPETTPVNELVETAYALEERVGVQLGPLVVNGVDDGGDLAIEQTTDPALAAAAEFRNARRQLHRREVERLTDLLALPQWHLPQVVTAGLTADDVARLATGLIT